jgi:3-carboxy-cis,cis-muconate cycloisomerase
MLLDPASAAAGSATVVAATDDRAWLTAMLEVERAMALGAAKVGLVDERAAAAVARACNPEQFELERLTESFALSATPVIAVVERLRELVPPSAQAAVHPGATSQDVVDSAMMLIIRRAVQAVLADADAVAAHLAASAREYRDTPMLGRTLGQHAAVTTFGAVCAARLIGVAEAASALADVARERLAVQFGGPVGTLNGAGALGPELVAAVAAELGLIEPVLPWHTARGRVGQVASALGVLSGELAGVALDVVLLSGGDIGELAVARPGRSSAMAHKRNPAAAVLALGAAHTVPGLVTGLLAGSTQELQRASGRWQAEAAAVTGLLRATGAVAARTRETLSGLQVRTEVMSTAVNAFVDRTGSPAGPGAAGVWVDRALADYESREKP